MRLTDALKQTVAEIDVKIADLEKESPTVIEEKQAYIATLKECKAKATAELDTLKNLSTPASPAPNVESIKKNAPKKPSPMKSLSQDDEEGHEEITPGEEPF